MQERIVVLKRYVLKLSITAQLHRERVGGREREVGERFVSRQLNWNTAIINLLHGFSSIFVKMF